MSVSVAVARDDSIGAFAFASCASSRWTTTRHERAGACGVDESNDVLFQAEATTKTTGSDSFVYTCIDYSASTSLRSTRDLRSV